ncbi:hypothetical protein HEP84_04765 [Streptomyces sp. RLB1-33]|uniref:hypothetical protein n=1 Tax=Streptomyces mirabilis TaxID=68239 RepID=UPI00143E6A82|nr:MULTISPECIES: hypothetical protein [Streptomyces]QIY68669.1 hypothetical protein HEP84_04765 [Streptomyces sp. RLB1-33]
MDAPHAQGPGAHREQAPQQPRSAGRTVTELQETGVPYDAEAAPGPGPSSRRKWRGGEPRCLSLALVGCGVAMLPWLVVLAKTLPDTMRVRHWSTAWVGLDALEALGLATTGRLLLRRDPRCALTATATAALLVTDAWFDVTTSAAGTEFTTAVVMALCAELPMATLCTLLAVRSLPRPSREPGRGVRTGW